MVGRKIVDFCVLRNIYISVFLVLLIARSVNVYSLMPSIIDGCIFGVVSIFGAVLTILRYLKSKNQKYEPFLIVLFVLICFSCIFNREYAFTANIREVLWCFINFFLIYSIFDDNKKIIHIARRILVISYFFLSIFSLITFLFQINYIFEPTKLTVETVRFGFIENRLSGVFINTNTAAKTALIAMIFSFFSIMEGSRSRFHFINIPIQFVYIVLSGSRTAFLAMSVILFILIMIFIKSKIYIKITIAAASVAALYGLSIVVKFVSAYIPPFIDLLFGINALPGEKIDLFRLDIENSGDISNMRFKIWKSAIEIFCKSPFFGASPRGIVEFAKRRLPQTFIAVRNYTSVHNIYIGILTHTGIFGAVSFYAFTFKILKQILDSFVKRGRYQLTLAVTIICAAIFAAVEPELLFVNTAVTIIFWIFAGEISNSKYKFA